MGTFDCMQGLIAGYIASPKGQQAIRTYLSSPEGKATIDAYLATPSGQQMARLLLLHSLDNLALPADAKTVLRTALEEKNVNIS
jgi:hypothetical protein